MSGHSEKAYVLLVYFFQKLLTDPRSQCLLHGGFPPKSRVVFSGDDQ